MFQTALRWMGGRWWATAALAATVIIMFRMSEVGAPSSTVSHVPSSQVASADPRPGFGSEPGLEPELDTVGGGTGAGLVEASFQRTPSPDAASPKPEFTPRPDPEEAAPRAVAPDSEAPDSEAPNSEVLELREEVLELQRALRLERERTAVFSQSYEEMSRQYGEIARLATLLMAHAESHAETQANTGAAGQSPKGQPLTGLEKAKMERGLELWDLRQRASRIPALNENSLKTPHDTGAKK